MTDDAPQPAPAQLDYASGERRRLKRWWIPIALILIVAAIAYWQRDRLSQWWRLATLARTHWRALNHSVSSSTIVYDEDPAAAQRLIAGEDYTSLKNGAAARNSPNWAAVTAAMGRDAVLLPTVKPGAEVFLHERRSPAGQRLLVYASYSGSELTVLVLGINSLTASPLHLGGKIDEDLMLFYPVTQDMSRITPHPEKHKVRIFAGQPDGSDPTRFWFDSEIDGQRHRTTLRILDPDSASTVPTWPRIEVVLPQPEKR